MVSSAVKKFPDATRNETCGAGILRLRMKFASRTSCSAQDDNLGDHSRTALSKPPDC